MTRSGFSDTNYVTYHCRMDDLDAAAVITSHRKALTLCPPGHPNRSYSLMNLADALYTRFEKLGRMEDLEDAISSDREALTLCPPGHPNRCYSLMNLANAVYTRFEQLGRMEDLEDAVSSHREALTLCPPGHPNHSYSLMNLAIAPLSSWAGWKIWKTRSHPTAKHSLSVLLATQLVSINS